MRLRGKLATIEGRRGNAASQIEAKYSRTGTKSLRIQNEISPIAVMFSKSAMRCLRTQPEIFLREIKLSRTTVEIILKTEMKFLAKEMKEP